MTSPADQNGWSFLRRLLQPHRRAVARYGMILALATAVPIVGALLLARFADLAVAGAPRHQLVAVAMGYALVGLLSSATTVLVTWRSTVLAWLITDRLRHDLARYVL